MCFNQTVFWIWFCFFPVQLCFCNTLRYFGIYLLGCGNDQKYLLYLFPWPYFYIYCCYSLWQAAADIFASILGHFMNENHGINIVPCHSKQQSLLNIEMTLQTALFFPPSSKLCCALTTTCVFDKFRLMSD